VIWLTNWLHYHAWEGVQTRRRKFASMPFDKITSDKLSPELKVGDTIWGFTRNENQYYLLGSITITWIGTSQDIPDYVTTELLFNQKKYTACCPTEDAGVYKAIALDELIYAPLPNFDGGSELGKLPTISLQGFLQIVDDEFVHEQFIDLHGQ